MIKNLWLRVRRTELGRHGLVLFGALTLANLSNYLFHVVISRMLGPRDYGALGALLSAFILISVPAGALQVVVAKRVAMHRARGEDELSGRLVRTMLVRFLVAGAVLGLIVAAASPIISEFLHLETLTPTLILAGYVLFAITTPVVRGALQGELLFKALAGLAAGTTVLRLVVGIVLVRLGFGVSGAVGASLVAEAAGALAGLLPIRSLLAKATKRKVVMSGLLKEAQLAILAFGGFWAVASIDTLLVRHYFPSEESGFYTAAAVAAHAVLFLPGAIAMVAFPKFAESSGRSVEARRILFHSIVAVTLLGVGAASVLVIFKTLVIKMLFGQAYLGGSVVIGALGFAMAFLGITNILVYFHLSTNSKALFSLVAALVLEASAIALFHETLAQVAFAILFVSFALLVFNLIAAYAHPGDPRVQPSVSGALWSSSGPQIDLSVVTPAFNPGPNFRGNLQELLGVLDEANLTYEVIAVSDGTTDDSHLVAGEMLDEGVRLIHYDINRGKGYALRMGLAQARGSYIAFIDSDGDLHPSELKSFVTLMKTHDLDLVVGSKRHPLSEIQYPPLRRIFSWIYHFLVKIMFGIKLSDTQTGLKLARREVLAQVLPRMLEKRFAFDLELLVIARLLGFTRVREAPVRLNYQFTSTIAPKTALAILIDTAAIFYRRYILRYYHLHFEDLREGALSATDQTLPLEVAELR